MHLTTSLPSPVRADSLVLLAPSTAVVPNHFADVDVDAQRHATLLTGLQRLRGEVYLSDQAIGTSQLQDGCHVQASDASSWHIVSVQGDGSVAGESVPTYFDPQYGCDMELLRFDSAVTSRRYSTLLGQVVRTLQHMPVVCATRAVDHGGQLMQPFRSLAAVADRHVPCFDPEEFAATA